jgi:hypothetical protein
MFPSAPGSRSANTETPRFRTERRLADLPDLEAGAFDPSAGAAGTLARLLTVETDGRWRHCYLAARAAGGPGSASEDRAPAGPPGLAALLPVYWPAGGRWPDPAYDPAGWPIPGLPAHEVAADHCLMVAGVYDQRTALHVPAGAAGNALARDGLRELARIAVELDRCLAFPFMHERSRRILDAATGGRIRWAVLKHEARFDDVLRNDPPGSRIRGVLRRDRRLIEQVAPIVSVIEWKHADPRSATMIAEHNVRKGQPDHPEFVRLRYDQWSDCTGVQVIMFDGWAGSLHGVLGALVWHDSLELLDIGLPDSDDPARLALYLDLVFHRPFAYAREHRLSTVRAGTAARTPKASRGATFEPFLGGVLNARDTRWLANGPDPRSAA